METYTDFLRVVFGGLDYLRQYSGVYHTFSLEEIEELEKNSIKFRRLTLKEAVRSVKPEGLDCLLYDATL